MQTAIRFFARHSVAFALGALVAAFFTGAYAVDFNSAIVNSLPFLLIATSAASVIALQNHYEFQVAKAKS